jgi:hypothetical protein
VPYLVAVVAAAVIAAVEQYNRLGARFTLRNNAGWWWLLRVAVEGAIGAAAIGIARHNHLYGNDAFLGWVAAGASASAIVRVRVLDLGRGEESRPIGLATFYEPLRRLIEDQIDQRSAECQTEWINFTLQPTLEREQTPPAQLAAFILGYLRGLPDRARRQKADDIAYIEGIRDGGNRIASSENYSYATPSRSAPSAYSTASRNSPKEPASPSADEAPSRPSTSARSRSRSSWSRRIMCA